MKRFLSCLGVLGLLVYGVLYVRAAGPTYAVSYSTGPNESNMIWGLDNTNGNTFQTGVIQSSGNSTSVLLGGLSVGTTTTFSGPTVYNSSSYTNIFATNTILPSSTFMVLYSSGGFPGNITMTSLPNISTTTLLGTTTGGTVAWSTGTYIILTGGTTAQITFQDAGTLASSGLSLINSTMVISSTRTYHLIYTGFKWTQVRGGTTNN